MLWWDRIHIEAPSQGEHVQCESKPHPSSAPHSRILGINICTLPCNPSAFGDIQSGRQALLFDVWFLQTLGTQAVPPKVDIWWGASSHSHVKLGP